MSPFTPLRLRRTRIGKYINADIFGAVGLRSGKVDGQTGKPAQNDDFPATWSLR